MRRPDLQASYDRWHRDRARGPALGTDPNQLRFYDWIFEHLRARSGSRLLDVACGQGSFLAYSRSRGLDVTGCDISEVAIEIARGRLPGARLEVADAETLPFPDSRFECVTCLGSLEHIPDPVAGAREISRVLDPQGTAVIFLPNLYFLGHIYFGLRHGTQPSEGDQAFSELFLTSGGWTELLSRGGLEVRAFHPWNRIYASEKVGPAVTRVWNSLSRLVPRHAAYGFAFECSKAVTPSSS